MQVVPNWRQAWRWLSLHALVATGALPSLWLALPPEWRAAVPASWLASASVVMALLGIVGRLTQSAPPATSTTPSDEVKS